MAARRQDTEQQRAAFAREAIQRVSAADDPDEAATAVLSQAPDTQHARAVLELAASAAGRARGALVRAAVSSGSDQVARLGAELLSDAAEDGQAMELLELCFKSLDPVVRRRATDAVENFVDPAAVEYLAQALVDDATIVRRSAAVVFGLVVGTPNHALRCEVLSELSDPKSALARSVVENDDKSVRAQIAQGLAFADSDEVLPTLEAMSRDEDPEVRQEVVLCLAAVGSDRAAELLSGCLDDPSYSVASTVLDMLAALLGAGSSSFLEQLERAVHHNLPEVRRQAVLMLDRFDHEEAVPVLEDASDDRDFEVARRAGEMLRRMRTESRLGWLADELSDQMAGERALPTWEAGNIGLEAGVRQLAHMAGAEESLNQVILMLEDAIREGDSSDRVHAVSELSSLKDIGQSPPMREALRDPDSAVRSRAADALSYTRDAGLLVDVLTGHPDPMVRRRAAEALAQNPGGRGKRGQMAASVSFSGVRTAGMELFSYLLKALRDEDTGVRQHACTAIRDCAQRVGLLPVRQTLRALERVEQDLQVSVLVQEDAAQTADRVRETEIGASIAQWVDGVLEWRGVVARQAYSLTWDSEDECYSLRRALDEETAEQWAEQSGLTDEQAEGIKGGGGRVDTTQAKAILNGVGRSQTSALECVAHASAALRLIGQQEHTNRLRQWAEAVKTGPRLDWGEDALACGVLARITRLRQLAWTQAQWAVASFDDAEARTALRDAADGADDWAALAALRALSELEGPDQQLERMEHLCAALADKRGARELVGQCAVILLSAGSGQAVPLLGRSLSGGRTDARMALTQRLMIAAQQPEVARALREHLCESDLREEACALMGLALRGAGAETADLDWSAADEMDDAGGRFALHGMRAMDNEPEGAQALIEALRTGNPSESYLAAWYLSLARVRSAVPVFASVRDQEVPYILQALASGSLLRRGHSGGPSWFGKVMGGISGEVKARVLTHLSAAVEDTIPLMLQCNDVNVGRFV